MFVSAFQAPFIQDDLDLLEKNFHVSRLIGHGVRQVFRIVLQTIHSDVVVCWFASVYAAVAVASSRLLGKRSIIILGGVDVAKDKVLQYGLWLSSWKSMLARYALTRADRVFVGDPAMKDEAIRLARYEGKNIEYLPPGFDSEYWKPLGEKEPVVLTVAAIGDDQRIRVKGIDTLLAAAQVLTNVRFVVIGVTSAIVPKLNVPENVSIHGLMSREELLPYYRRAKIYCQPSAREAVGYSLREAMLCGCVPVVSDVGGLRTAAAGIGVLVRPGNVEALIVGLQKALRAENAVAAKARAHIVALYPKQIRTSALVNAVERLAS